MKQPKLPTISCERNPMQPFVMDGPVIRFKANKIVKHMTEFAEKAGYDLNALASNMAGGLFSQDDYEQFSQLHGYSLAGFHELSHVSDETALQASQNACIQFKRTFKGCRDDDCKIHCGVLREEQR